MRIFIVIILFSTGAISFIAKAESCTSQQQQLGCRTIGHNGHDVFYTCNCPIPSTHENLNKDYSSLVGTLDMRSNQVNVRLLGIDPLGTSHFAISNNSGSTRVNVVHTVSNILGQSTVRRTVVPGFVDTSGRPCDCPTFPGCNPMCWRKNE